MTKTPDTTAVNEVITEAARLNSFSVAVTQENKIKWAIGYESPWYIVYLNSDSAKFEWQLVRDSKLRNVHVSWADEKDSAQVINAMSSRDIQISPVMLFKSFQDAVQYSVEVLGLHINGLQKKAPTQAPPWFHRGAEARKKVETFNPNFEERVLTVPVIVNHVEWIPLQR